MLELGFYYHSNFFIKNNQVIVPGYIGVFIDALAAHSKTLYLFLEEQTDPTSVEEDYVLQSPNIQLVNLGPRSTFYHRLFYPSRQLKVFESYIPRMDVFLQRIPTPIAPHFYKMMRKHKKPVYHLVVGDYVKSLKGLEQPPIRKQVIIAITYYYQWLHNRMIRESKILVNSEELYKDYQGRCKAITLIKTTTLSENSFFKRDDTCTGKEIRLLFTGRINFQKGLRELIDATATLVNNDGFNLQIDIVGWEEKSPISYEAHLRQQAEERGIGDRLFFHGKKQIGPELDAYYRQADIYVIPSYHEGFPRTIWEAMANSLPVIATTVGSIPFFLSDKEISLIPPQQTDALTQALRQLISDKPLRQSRIRHAFDYAQDCTLNKQTEHLIETIQQYTAK